MQKEKALLAVMAWDESQMTFVVLSASLTWEYTVREEI